MQFQIARGSVEGGSFELTVWPEDDGIQVHIETCVSVNGYSYSKHMPFGLTAGEAGNLARALLNMIKNNNSEGGQ